MVMWFSLIIILSTFHLTFYANEKIIPFMVVSSMELVDFIGSLNVSYRIVVEIHHISIR